MTQLDPRLQRATQFGREILPAVSRTFALSIRLLPGELGAAVRCAYLICRIADTVEDEAELPADFKASLLDALLVCFDDAAAADAYPRLAADVGGDPAHVQLVQHADLVFVTYRALPERTRGFVRHWVSEMIVGMRKFVLLYPHGIRI